MRELCLACAGFALEFIVFYAAGIVLVRILKVKGDCSLTFILGYLVYFAVFELVIVPMTLKWVSQDESQGTIPFYFQYPGQNNARCIKNYKLQNKACTGKA